MASMVAATMNTQRTPSHAKFSAVTAVMLALLGRSIPCATAESGSRPSIGTDAASDGLVLTVPEGAEVVLNRVDDSGFIISSSKVATEADIQALTNQIKVLLDTRNLPPFVACFCAFFFLVVLGGFFFLKSTPPHACTPSSLTLLLLCSRSATLFCRICKSS